MNEKFLVIAPSYRWACIEMDERGIGRHRWIYVSTPFDLFGRYGAKYFLFGWPKGLHEGQINEMVHYLLTMIQVRDFREEPL
jgi:hypothetical protein